MHSEIATGDSRLSRWRRVREFAVPPSMIERATARRHAGDWAGACAAAHIDVDLHLATLSRDHGDELVAMVRADLRRLAPDLLRWHMPRIAPDGLLRPGLTIPLARYPGGRVHLVARTPPAWAAAGQRISLALWDGSPPGAGPCHPHPRPDRRFRLDLHRHLWDASRAGELRVRSGAEPPRPAASPVCGPDLSGWLPRGGGHAVARWAAEAAILLADEGRPSGTVAVRLGTRCRLTLEVAPGESGDADGTGRTPTGSPVLRGARRVRRDAGLPVLPDAATWVPPDLELLRAGLITLDRLHPLVAAALAPTDPPGSAAALEGETAVPTGAAAPGQRLVHCRGAWHRIGLVDGALVPLDHDPTEIRREELLAALTGAPMPCLRTIDEAYRRPERLPEIRGRLEHGDVEGALAAVEDLLGPGALLRTGALRDELEAAAQRRVAHGLYRAGLAEPGSRSLRHQPDRPGPGRQAGRSASHRQPGHPAVR